MLSLATAGLDQPAATATVVVAMGRCAVATQPTVLRAAGLGSCLAIAVFAPAQRMVGVAHCMLPAQGDATGAPARYVDAAVPHLLAALRAAGASEPFSATLVGGASMFPDLADGPQDDIGRANIAAARAVLTNSAVPVRSEDVGGHIARSITVHPATQRVLVQTIRHGARCL
jgi:chemotaxis protein CheD